MYAIIVNEETKQVNVGLSNDINYYTSIGMKEMEVECDYNGIYYLKGYAPEMPIEIKQQKMKIIRDNYFTKYVDFYQTKPLLWAELSEEEKNNISNYRLYLISYDKTEKWYEKEPLTFEEWKEGIE